MEITTLLACCAAVACAEAAVYLFRRMRKPPAGRRPLSADEQAIERAHERYVRDDGIGWRPLLPNGTLGREREAPIAWLHRRRDRNLNRWP